MAQGYEESAAVAEQVRDAKNISSAFHQGALENRLERVEGLLERLLNSGICLHQQIPEVSLDSPLLSGDDPKHCHKTSERVRTPGLSNGEMYQAFEVSPVELPGPDTFRHSRSLTVFENGSDTAIRADVSNDLWPKSCDYERISAELHATLPSQRDADCIIACGNTASFLQLLCRPYRDVFQGGMLAASTLSSLPNPKSHPVLLARTLLYLAHGLQNLRPATVDTEQLNLGCSPASAMRRFVGVACRLAISKDELIESLEGLECLVLEGAFHINSGNLRRAWKVFRRAISLAQLMGLHLGDCPDLAIVDSSTAACPSFIWHRIVSQDRYLSLMLDLPPGTPDNILENPDDLGPADCPMGYLERVHCIIMSCITANKCGRTAIESNIDSEMQKAAHNMPPGWWELPSAKGKSNRGKDSLEDVLRILFHITHFSLLIYLRLPQMLHSADVDLHDHGESACVNASRELLKRYIGFRCMDSVAFCCTSVDFSAFSACLTLLLAHLRRWYRDPDLGECNLHQRLRDRDMVQETVELMLELDQNNGDTVLKRTAGVVTSLARMEADAAKHAGVYGNVGLTSQRMTSIASLEVVVPTFGAVNITRDGVFPRRLGLNAEKQSTGHKTATSKQAHQSPPTLRHDREKEISIPPVSGFEFDTSQVSELPDMSSLAYLQDLDSLGHYEFWYDAEVNAEHQTALPTSNPLELEIGEWHQTTTTNGQEKLLSEFINSLARE